MDNLRELTAEALASLATEKRTAFSGLIALDSPTTAQVDEAEALATDIEAIDSEVERRTTEAQATADRFAALRTRFSNEAPEEPVEEEEADENAEHEETVEESPGEVVPPGETAKAAEAPKAQARAKGVAALAGKTARPAAPVRSGAGPITITASADVQGFATGQHLNSLDEVAKAVINRAKGFGVPQGNGETVSLQQFGTAMFALDFPDNLTIDRHDDANEVMDYAIKESRLPGGSLVAAGGWCAPSETVYDLTDDSTTEGLLSLPEVNVKRGGIRYAVSPTFADFYTNPGFIQTEAQAIAGTTKPCVEVDCPDFVEVRLDAEGICIKVPILTNAAYPEVVRNFVSGTLTAHQHWINANVIGRLVTQSNANRAFVGLGSTVSDTIEALGIVIDQTRQKYRLSFNASVEVVVPFWLKNAFKADLSRRNGRGTAPVSDQELAAHFAQVGANVQYVYDWQALDESAEVYPATFQALVYPAGTFVKGTSNVISLNTVYDAASLATNVYTGLFAEQGLLVAKKKFHSDIVTLPICNAGRTGAADFTCATV